MTSIGFTAVRTLPFRLNWSAGMAKLFMLALFGLICLSARGTTEMEDRMNKSPMPHEGRGTSGALVKVHWVSSRGYLGSIQDNAAELAKLRASVQDCIKHTDSTQVKPVRAWPDFVYSNRIDIYSSANRSIRYSTSLIYGLHRFNCDLMEQSISTADLSSARGICSIDLIKKTAYGECDSKAHSDAPAPNRVPATSLAEVEVALKNRPNDQALAALAAAMRQNPPESTGMHKMIAGIKCEVWRSSLLPGANGCVSLGGSFVAYPAAQGLSQSSMDLELTSTFGPRSRAVAARLDTMVDPTVFAPYLGNGFTIKITKVRK